MPPNTDPAPIPNDETDPIARHPTQPVAAIPPPPNNPAIIEADEPTQEPAPAPTQAPTAPNVTWADIANPTKAPALPTNHNEAPSYSDLTGAELKAQKRKARYNWTKTRQQKDIPTTTSNLPVATTPPIRRSTRPRKYTLKKKAQQEAANIALTLTAMFPDHFALHGTAINPDTGNLAEYRELLSSSDGDLWSTANDEEIGRMTSGLGPTSNMPTGTEC